MGESARKRSRAASSCQTANIAQRRRSALRLIALPCAVPSSRQNRSPAVLASTGRSKAIRLIARVACSRGYLVR